MSIRKIAVLGAGNGGVAAAADLALRGYEVRLFSRSAATLAPIVERGGIEIVEEGRLSFARPALATAHLEEAVSGADLVMVAAPAVAHDYFAATLARLVTGRELLFLNPGHTGGALHFAWALRRAGLAEPPPIAESVTLTYICRLKGGARVEVYRRTTNLKAAAFPGKLTSGVVARLRPLYAALVPARHTLETGLSNINAIMHPAGMVANAGWIEARGGDFLFYREGIGPAVASVIEAVDRERLEIVRALGLEPATFVEIFHAAGLTSDAARASGSVHAALQESAPNRTIQAPPRLAHRYLDEDVGYGLVPMAELARLFRIETPVIDALITLAGAMNRVDYRERGLTLEKMGLAGIGPGRISEYLEQGR
jgi:opine dehydrogenase